MLVSRGELIEIGDGFRIPDVLARSGRAARRGGDDEPDARRRLRARARPGDRAAPARAPVELPRRRVHRATRRRRPLRTWPAEPASPSWTTLAPALSGQVTVCYLRTSPRPETTLADGADLVCFSGDKLLGGPQAGIVVGRADLVERLRRHPLQRALRADKLTLAALEGTLALHLDPERARAGDPGAAHAGRAGRRGARAGGAARGGRRRRGRGDGRARRRRRAAARRAAELRLRGRGGAGRTACGRREPPVVAIVRDGRTLLDCRTLSDAEADEVAAAVLACRSR